MSSTTKAKCDKNIYRFCSGNTIGFYSIILLLNSFSIVLISCRNAHPHQITVATAAIDHQRRTNKPSQQQLVPQLTTSEIIQNLVQLRAQEEDSREDINKNQTTELSSKKDIPLDARIDEHDRDRDREIVKARDFGKDFPPASEVFLKLWREINGINANNNNNRLPKNNVIRIPNLNVRRQEVEEEISTETSTTKLTKQNDPDPPNKEDSRSSAVPIDRPIAMVTRIHLDEEEGNDDNMQRKQKQRKREKSDLRNKNASSTSKHAKDSFATSSLVPSSTSSLNDGDANNNVNRSPGDKLRQRNLGWDVFMRLRESQQQRSNRQRNEKTTNNKESRIIPNLRGGEIGNREEDLDFDPACDESMKNQVATLAFRDDQDNDAGNDISFEEPTITIPAYVNCRSKKDGYYADEKTQCTCYFRCSSYEAVDYNCCTQGLIFNEQAFGIIPERSPENPVCDFYQEARRDCPRISGFADMSCVRIPENRFYAVPTDNCKSFFGCFRGATLIRSRCPENLLFDESVQACNYPELVNCDRRGRF